MLVQDIMSREVVSCRRETDVGTADQSMFGKPERQVVWRYVAATALASPSRAVETYPEIPLQGDTRRAGAAMRHTLENYLPSHQAAAHVQADRSRGTTHSQVRARCNRYLWGRTYVGVLNK